MTYNFVWILSFRHSNDRMEVSRGIITEREYLPQRGTIAPYVTLGGELEGEETLGRIPKVQLCRCTYNYLIARFLH